MSPAPSPLPGCDFEYPALVHMFTLETERLIVRPWEEGDRPAFASIMSDPETMRYIHDGKPFTEEEVDDFFERQSRQLADRGVCMGAACERTGGDVIGVAGVQPLGTTDDFEIGWIFDRAVWGRGFATEAGGAAVRYVLETLERPRVVAIIDPHNTPSKRVAARLGMQFERRCTGRELGHRLPEIVVDLYFRNRS